MIAVPQKNHLATTVVVRNGDDGDGDGGIKNIPKTTHVILLAVNS